LKDRRKVFLFSTFFQHLSFTIKNLVHIILDTLIMKPFNQLIFYLENYLFVLKYLHTQHNTHTHTHHKIIVIKERLVSNSNQQFEHFVLNDIF